MARNNNSMNVAKKEQNDEFYTLYEDIERETMHYWNYNKDVFQGKTVLLPADDIPGPSNFKIPQRQLESRSQFGEFFQRLKPFA